MRPERGCLARREAAHMHPGLACLFSLDPTLPRLGSRVRIRSPAPDFLKKVRPLSGCLHALTRMDPLLPWRCPVCAAGPTSEVQILPTLAIGRRPERRCPRLSAPASVAGARNTRFLRLVERASPRLAAQQTPRLRPRSGLTRRFEKRVALCVLSSSCRQLNSPYRRPCHPCRRLAWPESLSSSAPR